MLYCINLRVPIQRFEEVRIATETIHLNFRWDVFTAMYTGALATVFPKSLKILETAEDVFFFLVLTGISSLFHSKVEKKSKHVYSPNHD